MRVREASVEKEVRSLIDEADVVLYNWRGRIEYRAVIRSLIRELGILR